MVEKVVIIDGKERARLLKDVLDPTFDFLKDMKLTPAILEEIKQLGEEEIKRRLFLSDEEFERGKDSMVDIRNSKQDIKFLEVYNAYQNLKEILKKYCDWKEEYYIICSCWIIGTYLHKQMLTYPLLYFNASRGSGKSRSVRLITYLSSGQMVNSITESVLFRTQGTLGIDEFEKASRKGNEALIELLNSSYKKGAIAQRMKKVKTLTGEEHQVETFDIFRPIVLANIWGMDSVLQDRAISMYLEKTTRKDVGNLLEIWEFDDKVKQTMAILKGLCSLCSVVTIRNIYIGWNEYIINNYSTTGTYNYIKLHLFEKIRNSGLSNRMLELSFPLILIADLMDDVQGSVVDELIIALRNINIEKSQEAFMEDKFR